MKSTTVEEINSVQRRLKVTVQSQLVDEEFNGVFKRIQRKASISGFRRGKAPIHIVKKVYSNEASQEVAETLVRKNLYPALEKQEFTPIGSPMVEVASMPALGADYEFSAVIDIRPQFELAESYKNIAINYTKYEISDDTVNREIAALLRREAKTTLLPEGTVVADGHYLRVDQEAALEDGSVVANLAAKSQGFILGTERVLPGANLPAYEAALLGKKAGESVESSVSIPEDHSDKNIAGKTVSLKLSIVDVSSIEIPEFNDEFAKDYDFTTADEFRAAIKKDLLTEAERRSDINLHQALLGELVNKVQFEVPPNLHEQAVDEIISSYVKDEKARARALKDDAIRKAFKGEAKRRLQEEFLVLEIARQEKMEISDEEIRKAIEESVAEQHTEGSAKPDMDALFNRYNETVRRNLIFEKVFELIKANGTIQEDKVQV